MSLALYALYHAYERKPEICGGIRTARTHYYKAARLHESLRGKAGDERAHAMPQKIIRHIRASKLLPYRIGIRGNVAREKLPALFLGYIAKLAVVARRVSVSEIIIAEADKSRACHIRQKLIVASYMLGHSVYDVEKSARLANRDW